HFRMGVKQNLDLARIDLHALRDEEYLLPVNKIEVAFHISLANIARKQQKPLVLQDSVFQNGEGFLVFLAEPQKSGIGADAKGFFSETVMVKVHRASFSH
ncbi:MAG: hypothetical protein JSV83_11510, partial [Desulfobacterales bacterium]